MIEKITLALVITFALYWSVQTRPPQRSVSIASDRQVQTVAWVRVGD